MVLLLIFFSDAYPPNTTKSQKIFTCPSFCTFPFGFGIAETSFSLTHVKEMSKKQNKFRKLRSHNLYSVKIFADFKFGILSFIPSA